MPDIIQSDRDRIAHPNGFLGRLTPADYNLLQPSMRMGSVKPGQHLLYAGESVQTVCFPHGGLISLLTYCEGESAETALLGRYDTVGSISAMLGTEAQCSAVVQIGAPATFIDSGNLRAAATASATLHRAIIEESSRLCRRVQLRAVCAALHELEPRLASWLLRCFDRSQDGEIAITQEAISELLGVRRTSVTLIAQSFLAKGLISYRRGRIEIRDREGLTTVACSCHVVDRLLDDASGLAQPAL